MGIYNVQIVGLRDLLGRFASMRDAGVVAIQLEEARGLAEVVQDVYRRHAPRSAKGGHKHFADGLDAAAAASEVGFAIELTTDDPELRRWLTEGTGVYAGHGRIYPTGTHKALGPIFDWPPGGSGPLWFSSIAGMEGSAWEEDALAEVEPLVESVGRSIGIRVVEGLSGGAE